MKVLVACESSGRVRDAFRRRGHDAISCDLEPSETPGPHIIGDVLAQLDAGWDMVLAFPPCRYLSRVASRYWQEPTWREHQVRAGGFARALWSARAPRVCVENPPGRLPEFLGRFHQTIQPWHFGEPYTKLTCLWLRGLPPLMSTFHSCGRTSWTTLNQANSKQRSRRRSRTFPGLASAMAAQWG